jgi:hypothetical protein
MQIDTPQPATVSGYAAAPLTKAPNWHALVALDVLFNNLTTGLFLAAALGELAAPESFGAVAKVAYPIALVLLLADLACLVLDLGDPRRFHHMLRVFKPTSPMSLGTWCLTVYALPLTVLVAINLLSGDGVGVEWTRRLAVIVGILPALGAAVYKGVLFSTSSQPGWQDARWLGGYLASSAVLLGCAELLVLSILMGQDRAVAVLRTVVALLLVLNVVVLVLLLLDVRVALSRAYSRAARLRLGAVTLGGEVLLPLCLLAVGGRVPMLAAVVLLVLGALLTRHEIVSFPHVVGALRTPPDDHRAGRG